MKPTIILGLIALTFPAFAQTPSVPPTPEIILQQQKKKQADSRTLAGQPLPIALNALGSLANDLIAYFPMDDTAKGCLAWSRKPISVTATSEVEIKEADGRRYADFSRSGACLVFDPPLDLGRHYTLTAWVQAPAPPKKGAIWHGAGGLLFLGDKELSYWVATTKVGGDYAKTAAPLAGWMHVAVVADGSKTQAFLNGTPLDSVKGIVSQNLITVGTHPEAQLHDLMRAAGIDEQYFFSRNLSPDEIKRLIILTQPKK